MESKKPESWNPSLDYETHSFLSDESDDGGTLTWRKTNEPPGSLDDFPFFHIDDSFTSRTTLGSRKSSTSGRPHSSSANQVDERVFYADPDFVTNSGDLEEPGSTKRQQRQNPKGNFDLERWWLIAPLWIRLIPFLLILFLGVAATHLVYALVCFANVGKEWADVPDPYACATSGCLAIAKSLEDNILESADPCKDFYEFACGGFINEEQDPDAIPESPRLTHAFQARFLDAFLSDILKLRGDKTDKAVDFYKSCLNEKSRLEVGIDPLLRLIVELLPSAFADDPTVLTNDDYLKETIAFSRIFGEFGTYRYHLRPNHTISFARPDWILYYGTPIRKVLGNAQSRLNYELGIAKFFEKMWDRMEELKLIDVRPFSGKEAAEVLIIMFNGLLNYVYNPGFSFPVPIDMTYVEKSREGTKYLVKGVLGGYDFRVENSEIPVERYAFGDFDGNFSAGAQVGSFLFALQNDAPLEQDFMKMGSKSGSVNERIYRAYNSLYIFLIFNAYVGDIRPKTFLDLEMHKVFLGRFPQDMMRFLRIETYCMSSMVYYLNSFAKLRLYDTRDHKTLEKIKLKVDRLNSVTKQSMRRWYTTRNSRAGNLDPRMNRITLEFFSTRNPIFVDFPLTELTKDQKKKLERQASYLNNWTVDPFNYIDSIVRGKGLTSDGRLLDWQQKKLDSGDNLGLYMDFMLVSPTNPVSTKYRNSIGFPLALMGPPYYDNDIKALDYAGTGVFMARAELFLWFLSTIDPGSLQISKEELAGLSKVPPSGRHVDECRTISPQTLNRERTSFSKYIRTPEGLHALALRLAYQLYKYPDQFETLIDIETGEPFKTIRHSNGSEEFIAPEFFSNGSVVFWYWTRNNGTATKKPVNSNRFINPKQHEQHRLQYRKLSGLEYNLDQLFFLHSISTHCYSSHGKLSKRYQRHSKLLNGIYQQLPELAEAFECSQNAPMNPSEFDSCFIDHQGATDGAVESEDEDNIDHENGARE